MKTLLLLLSLVASAMAGLSLNANDPEDKCGGLPCAKNYRYIEDCATAIRDQITRELDASITYLAAGAHFAQDNVNRPGISDMFFDHAGEERGHAFKLADYLLMRGDHNTNYLQARYQPLKDTWKTGIEALTDALNIEKAVTRHFTNMIKVCELDWHAADWLTAEMLDEQHKGVREFTGHITTLRKMQLLQPNLAEYMFDQELQSDH
ncbi:ferritin subunit-like [Pollicipes pollicipes]|uniref:ferritin subunit-like n=1 Tax=Pollicipes pollicipes TaxID=41117 RepID=UPI00188579C0|nr:ferritin subunit-like [Pollicipes pollicipes]XP_037093465.1 ferritin subunit-like [Pollicipes pollicipes]